MPEIKNLTEMNHLEQILETEVKGWPLGVKTGEENEVTVE